MATTQKKSDDTGAALPPTRILNAGIALWWMGVVTKAMLNILKAHGIVHYQTVGVKQEAIEEGDMVIIEGYELKGLYEVFQNAKAARKDWHSHVGIVRHDHLDWRGYARLLSALKTGKLSDIASFSFMPDAIQAYWTKYVETRVRDKVVLNPRGVAVDSGEPERVIASLDMILTWVNSPEAKPVARKIQRDLPETDLQRVLHVAPATADLFASNSWLPTESAVATAMTLLHADGFKYAKGDDDLPQKVQQLHASATPIAAPSADNIDEEEDDEEEDDEEKVQIKKKKGKKPATKKVSKATKPKGTSSKARATSKKNKRKADDLDDSEKESEADSNVQVVKKKKRNGKKKVIVEESEWESDE